MSEKEETFMPERPSSSGFCRP